MAEMAGATDVPCWVDNSAASSDPALHIEVSHERGPSLRSLCIAHGASPELALATLRSAAKAREQWSRTSSVDRLRILQQVSNIFERHRETLLLYLGLELGLSPAESEGIFSHSVSEMNRTSSRFAAAAFSNRHISGLGPRDSPIATTPTYVGATMIIASPVLPLLLQTIANSLSSGRTLVMLAANGTPRIHHLVATAFAEAGLSAGCLNKIHVRPENEVHIVMQMMQDSNLQMVEVCEDRREVQERMWEIGRATATHVVMRVPPVD